MSHKEDLDYLTISARVHAMENRLLSREQMERMIEARDVEEAVKVLTECGYPVLETVTNAALEEMLAQSQAALYHDLGSAVGEKKILEIFQSKYDYHNAKVLVKAEAQGVSADRLLIRGGRYAPDRLKEDYEREDLRACSDYFRRGIARARETLGSTGDPQVADFILDRAYFEELTALAKACESPFLLGYVALCIDVANLRSAVRAARLGKGIEVLNQVLIPGGNVPVRLLATARGDELGTLFRTSPLAKAAELGASLAVPGGGSLTEFERLCDNAILNYLAGGRRVAFGEQPIIGYLYAREAEITAIRILMTGRMAGLDGDTIRARLRETYG